MIRKSLTLAVLAFVAFFTPLVASTDAVQAGFGSGCASFHTVQRGETLSRIARSYGFTTSQLAALNGIANPNRIYVGQSLCIGERGSDGSVGGTSYTVQSGDTLSRIARRFGVEMTVLARVNGITNANRIYVGQVLTIPDFTIQTGG